MQTETTNFPQEIGRCKLHQKQLKTRSIVYFFRFMYHLLKNSHKYNEHLIKYLVIIYACKYNKNKYKMQNKKEFFLCFSFLLQKIAFIMCLVEQAIYENCTFALFFIQYKYIVHPYFKKTCSIVLSYNSISKNRAVLFYFTISFQKIVQYCFILQFYLKKSCKTIKKYDIASRKHIVLLCLASLFQKIM